MKSTYARLIHTRFLIVVFAVFMLQACGEAPEPEVKEVVRPIKMMTLGGGSDGATLEYPGVVSATRSVELGFEVPGKIIELPITEGQEVTEGDLLARLDPADYEAARDAAESNRRALSIAYNRAKKIFEQGAGSQAEVDKTLRDIQVAREELKKAQKALDDASLKAPFSGEIARKTADNFQNVQAKETILLLQDISSLEMDVTVPEQDFALAKAGLTPEQRTNRVRPEIVISSIPDQTFSGALQVSFDRRRSGDPHLLGHLYLCQPGRHQHPPGYDGEGNPAPATGKSGSYRDEWLHGAGFCRGRGRAGQCLCLARRCGQHAGVARAGKTGRNGRRPKSGYSAALTGGDRIAISGVHHLREGMTVRPLGE